jgi:hypothetical protein
MATAPAWPSGDACIRRALADEGGHLFVHERGYTLHLGGNGTLRGYDTGPFKAAYVAAGLPVIDTRMLDPSVVFRLAAHSPMAAVARAPDPPPWTPFTWAPLRHLAGIYRAAGVEVLNLDGDGADMPEVAA